MRILLLRSRRKKLDVRSVDLHTASRFAMIGKIRGLISAAGYGDHGATGEIAAACVRLCAPDCDAVKISDIFAVVALAPRFCCDAEIAAGTPIVFRDGRVCGESACEKNIYHDASSCRSRKHFVERIADVVVGNVFVVGAAIVDGLDLVGDLRLFFAGFSGDQAIYKMCEFVLRDGNTVVD